LLHSLVRLFLSRADRRIIEQILTIFKGTDGAKVLTVQGQPKLYFHLTFQTAFYIF
jgi:hypothetical protein